MSQNPLDQELAYYTAISALIKRARDLAKSNPYDPRISDLGLPSLGKTTKDRRAALDDDFDGMIAAVDDAFLLRLVAAFEVASFARLGTCVGESRKALNNGLPNGTPFARAAAKLLRNPNEMKLTDIVKLCEAYPAKESKAIDALREHRNYVAHGGRIGKQSTFSKLTDVHRTLGEMLTAIGEADDQ